MMRSAPRETLGMANTPFRGGSKIGRNDPCLCGSGRSLSTATGSAAYSPGPACPR